MQFQTDRRYYIQASFDEDPAILIALLNNKYVKQITIYVLYLWSYIY